MGRKTAFCFVLLAMAAAAPGCAIIERLPGAPKRAPASPADPEVVHSLDQLPSVRAERVTVPTRVLRDLVESEQALREQLDAIKRVDLDGAARKGARP
jgi:hypothetical protein